MRVRVYTPAGDLGELKLADGVVLADVLDALRGYRLYVTPAVQTAAAAQQLPAEAVATSVAEDQHTSSPTAPAHRPAGRRRGSP